jgi:hypothetical protein
MPSDRLPWRLALLGYELRIFRRGSIWFTPAILFLVSVALMLGSGRASSYHVSLMVLEQIACLVLLFNATALLSTDCDSGTIERLFSGPGRRSVVYLRRFGILVGLDVAVLVMLAILWQLDRTSISMPRALMVAVPPVVFLSAVGFFAAVLARDANVGAALAAGWWFVNRILLPRYANRGVLEYVFLFKESYYPASSTFVANRLVLLLLGLALVGLMPLLLKDAERYL